MDKILEAKVLSWYANIKEYLETGKCNPRTLMLQPSSVCNNRCEGCYYLKSKIPNVKYMGLDTIKTVVNDSVEHLGIHGISLSGGGEPTIHPDFKEMMKFLVGTGKALSLITNGTWKNPEISKILAKDFTFVRVGLDCGSREQYKRIKKRDHFFTVIKNIKDLVKYKDKATIGVKFLLRKYNCDPRDVYKMIDLGLSLGADYLQFKPLMNDITQPSEAQIKNLRVAMTQFGEKKVHLSLGRTSIQKQCYLNMLRINIDTDGSVYLCSRYHHRMDSHYIGNVNKGPICAIWKSDKHWKAIKKIKPEECNLYNCMLHKAHTLVEDDIMKNPFHLEFAA